MINTLFLQSEMENPFAVYEKMREHDPVYRDDSNNMWIAYSYEACSAILNHPLVKVPPVPDNPRTLWNEYARKLRAHLARLNNGGQHAMARQAANLLLEKMRASNPYKAIDQIIRTSGQREMDWVNSVAKRLPAIVLLQNFQFTSDDQVFIVDRIAQLVKIMSPCKSPEQETMVNEVCGDIYNIVEKHFTATSVCQDLSKDFNHTCQANDGVIACFFICNYIGLLIQSYDAGRGLLTNMLLSILRHDDISIRNKPGKDHYYKILTEILRFDPPVHHTRRVAAGVMSLSGRHIREGQTILVMLAAANRDPKQFVNPDKYDVYRQNNCQHLSFGTGPHLCPGRQLVMDLTIDALHYFFEHYGPIRLIDDDIQYEPLYNVRLASHMFISFTQKTKK